MCSCSPAPAMRGGTALVGMLQPLIHGELVERLTVTLPSGREVPFEIDADARERLLNGWDEIALTEKRIEEIERYEAERERYGPNTLAI